MVEKWQIGDVIVTKVLEEVIEGDEFQGLIVGATREALLDIEWLRPHFLTEQGAIRLSFHALVIETRTRRIIVDTCVGNGKTLPDIPFWHRQQKSFLAKFAEAGFTTDSIDTVLCTHLHVDHVGWNTTQIDGCWIPTFKNARYLFGQNEYEYWSSEMRCPSGDPLASLQTAVMRESVQPLFDAKLVDLVPSDHRICDEVVLVPTHGHTPGHVSVSIESSGQRALITGDFVHHPCQLAHPEWGTIADTDQAASSRTREHEFRRLADTDVLVIGTHWATPTAGRIVTDGPAYKIRLSN